MTQSHDGMNPTKPEFSRRVEVAKLPPEGVVRKIEADTGERAALAERLDLVSLDRLDAELHVKFVAGGPLVRVAGRFQASAVQSCVVTLEPVPAVFDEPVETMFGPPVEMPVEVEFTLADEDPPEPFENGCIDLGEIVVQHLAVVLDPYPRAPGAELSDIADSDGRRADSPFAALAGFKKER